MSDQFQGLAACRTNLEAIDQELYKALYLPEKDFIAQIDQVCAIFYQAVVESKDISDAGSKEVLRRYKRQLVYLFERLQDLEKGWQDRAEFHRVIDTGLSYVTKPLRGLSDPSEAGKHEVEETSLGSKRIDVGGMGKRGPALVLPPGMGFDGGSSSP